MVQRYEPLFSAVHFCVFSLLALHILNAVHHLHSLGYSASATGFGLSGRVLVVSVPAVKRNGPCAQ